MNATQLLTGPLAQAIGWALLHLLWQATIVAGILAAVLALIPRQSANARYSAACGALGLVFALFIATAWRAYDPAVAHVSPAPLTEAQATKITLNNVPVVLATIAAETWRDRLLSMVASARQTLPSIVAVWLMGVVFLSSRLLLSWMRARRLAKTNAQPASIQWQRVARRLSESLGLRRAVRLLESSAVEVPSVIGMLRPVILLPASTLTGLTPEQIEMVLAHELAHIRRHDFLVNLLQAVVETLMFYHPAVWWMSRRVRIERENCCDDMAVAVCGNPIQYAKALTRLEELRSAPSLVVAANGGSLLDRIRRIAGVRAESTAVSARWAAAMITLVVLAIGVGIPSLPAFAQREEQPAEPARVRVDVTAPAEPTAAADAEPVDAVAEVEEEADVTEDMEDADYEPELPPIAPMARAAALAAIDSARPAPTPYPAPAIAGVRAPRTPMAPVAIAMAGKHDFDFEYEDDDEEESERRTSKKIGSEQLTIDELIGLKAVGVTPEYIDTMRAIFGDLTVGQVSGLKALGVTADYVREIRAAGLEVANARTAQGLKAMGVTAEYVRELRAAGVDLKTAKEAQSLAATGVTAKFVQQLAAAGYTNLTPKELSRMAAVGVDGDFIREMSKYKKK